MASALFHGYEKTMRRMFWAEMLDREYRNASKAGFKASLVVHAHTGRPIASQAPAAAPVVPETASQRTVTPLAVVKRARWSLQSQLQLLRDSEQMAA